MHYQQPRHRASSEIKLLRLELLPKSDSPCEQIGTEWSPAQPTQSLSPESAAAALGVELWAPASAVLARYRTLQLRYPPDQFSEKHLTWRPAAELLGTPQKRLNWLWQAALIPYFSSQTPPAFETLWDKDSVEPPIEPLTALARIQSQLTQ